MLENCHRIHGTWPDLAASPLTAGDHPRIQHLQAVDLMKTTWKICQSLIGALQWAIQIGRFGVQTAAMTLSHFRAVPRQGHLDHVKRIHGCLSKMCHATIKIRTDAPDCFDVLVNMHESECSC